MLCKCGFENAADARFCGRCRAALGDGSGTAVPNAAVSSTAARLPTGGVAPPGARWRSRALMATVAVVAVVVAAGYWWLNRPPERYKADNSGLHPIKVDGKYGFMDRSGKTVITPQFDKTGGFSEGLAWVQIGTKVGYINTKGAVVITPQFDGALQFQYGRAAVKLGNRWGFIDKDGKYINSPDFRWAGQFSGDLAPVMTADGAVAFVNRSGKTVISGKFDHIDAFSAGLAPAASGGKWGFIDTTGKWVIDPQFEGAGKFADGLAPVIVGGRTGYIDQKGRFVVNPQYDSGREFYEGYASVVSGGEGGFIDTKGRVVGDQKFWNGGHFSEGLAPVKIEGGWGYIDTTGKWAMDPQFDSAEVFQNGLARVTIAGKEAYVTTSGAFVVDPFPGRAGIPAHPVQEIWQDSDTFELFMLIREGTQILGHHAVWTSRFRDVIDIKGQAAQDGSFSMVDDNGASWKGQFVSSVLIKGVQVNPPEGSSKNSSLRLHLVRDATANEREPLPPTNSDWNVFLSSFKDAVQRRDYGVLSSMVARGGFDTIDLAKLRDIASQKRRTPAEALAGVKWDEVDRTLARGVERSSSTPRGRATRLILDEHPCPGCRYQVRLRFIQDGDHHWRWLGIDYPGD